MERLANPFNLRTTESISSDELFLQLFSTEPMKRLVRQQDDGKLWNFVTYIQSPPGFGKTSLLRIFNPSVLKRIVKHKSEMHDIYTVINKLGVKENNDIKKCGVY